MAIVFGVLVAYASLAALAFFGQRSLMYPVPPGGRAPHASGARFERITADGRLIACALYAKALQNRATIVHFHGNGEELADQGSLIESLRAGGLGVYAVEYAGYGMLREHALSEKNIYEAAEAALRHLRTDLGVPSNRIVLQGQSLGTGIAVEMARRGHGMRLILISPFASMMDMGKRILPWLPVRWLVRDRYDTAAKAAGLALPALIIHGTDDEIIPVEMGRAVAKLLPHSKLVLIEGGHHNDLFVHSGERMISEITEFALAVQ